MDQWRDSAMSVQNGIEQIFSLSVGLFKWHSFIIFMILVDWTECVKDLKDFVCVRLFVFHFFDRTLRRHHDRVFIIGNLLLFTVFNLLLHLLLLVLLVFEIHHALNETRCFFTQLEFEKCIFYTNYQQIKQNQVNCITKETEEI